MSSPTSGSDPNYPQGNVPQGQPDWNAPQGPPPQGYTPQQGYTPEQGYGAPPQGYGDPQQGYGGPAPAYSGAPAGGPGAGRPSQVTAAAIIGLVIGGLGTLFGLLALFAIGLLFAISALLGILALLSLAASIVVLVGGIQTIQGKSPRLLLLGSYASIALQVLYLIIAIAVGEGFSFTSLLGFILPGVIVWLLMQPQSKQYFASRGISY
jgi:hypothetical protein